MKKAFRKITILKKLFIAGYTGEALSDEAFVQRIVMRHIEARWHG